MAAASAGSMAIQKKLTDLIWAPMRLNVVQAAVQTGILEPLSKGAKTAAQVAKSTRTDARAVRMVLDEMAALGFLTRKSSAYSLASDAAKFLLKDSPLFMSGFISMGEDLSWKQLPDVIKTGRPPVAFNQTDTGEQFFRELVRRIYPGTYLAAQRLMKYVKLPAGDSAIMDIGAGTAAWSLPFAEKHRKARVTAVDLPFVLEVTREYTKKHGVADRYEYAAGNLRDVEFGKDRYDLILIGHICHSEGPVWSKKLITRAARALKPGGILAVPDMVPNDTRTGPEFPLLFAINMLLHTTEGDTFTFAEYSAWMKAAGLTGMKLIGTHQIGCDVVVAQKPASKARR